jgi:hypothetical protein
MEEAEVPLEHLHEKAHETARHSRETWISWVALSTAILAVLPESPVCYPANTPMKR